MQPCHESWSCWSQVEVGHCRPLPIWIIKSLRSSVGLDSQKTEYCKLLQWHLFFPWSNKKTVLSQRWPCNARLIYRCPENFWDSLTIYTNATFPKNFSWAFVPINPVNMRTKFEVCSFTGIIGIAKKTWGGPCPIGNSYHQLNHSYLLILSYH